MIDRKLYLDIARDYGEVASWAVWKEAEDKPKSNISEMKHFDIDANPSLLSILRTDVVMVALNFSRAIQVTEPFQNFHDPNPSGQDYKIRYAFEGTEYYGAYMTDIIKDYPELNSKDVLKYLNENSHLVAEQFEGFRKEMKAIGSMRPLILCFGRDTYRLLYKNLGAEEYSRLIQLTHYSHHIGKENYRSDVHGKLDIQTATLPLVQEHFDKAVTSDRLDSDISEALCGSQNIARRHWRQLLIRRQPDS